MKHYNTNMLLCRDFPSLLLNMALNHKCWLATNFYNFPHFPHFLPSSSFLYNQTLDKQPSCFATLHSYSDIFILASHISIVCVWLLSYLICLLDKITLYYHHLTVFDYSLTLSSCTTSTQFAPKHTQCVWKVFEFPPTCSPYTSTFRNSAPGVFDFLYKSKRNSQDVISTGYHVPTICCGTLPARSICPGDSNGMALPSMSIQYP